jgi:nicotinate-nucleotide--dimethylbenzimidazole phosphoribosyltransferase
MSPLARALAAIRVPDPEVARLTQALLNAKTKPRRSLGRLEDLACQIAAIRGVPAPPVPRAAIVVMAADHGVADEGVSAYPAEVTAQMLVNFARGGAAINVLARQTGVRLVVVDMGTRAPPPDADGVVSRRIGPGTHNFTRGPAMTASEAVQALDSGIALAAGLADEGIDLVGLGEMGIGNTTAASALTAALLGLPPEEVTGRGTGIDDQTWRRKVEAVRRALAVNRPDPGDPLAVLAALGGFEIAGLAGVALGAAARRLPVLADGFIAGVAALIAARLAPPVAGHVLAAHRSVEIGHRAVLAALGARPLLDLDLRLGEGTGAALAVPLVQAAVRLVHEMATFAAAGVSDAGR